MEVVEEILTENGKKLQLLKGDLTNLPEEHKVDVLILSAFPNDYIPTPTSLIGALFNAGLSVDELALDKEVDFRVQFHCWLSKEVNFNNIRRILCFEPRDRTHPYGMIAGIYQSIMPFTATHHIKSIAMPLILTGDQGFSHQEVIKELISTNLFWLNNDSSLETIKIVERGNAKIEMLKEAFLTLKSLQNKNEENEKYDFFISYSRSNSDLAQTIYDNLKNRFNIFFDTQSIDIGANWLNKINTSMPNSDRFIVCISPDYLNSKMCRYEYLFCNLKFIEHGNSYVLPIHLYSSLLPFEMQILNFYDAREGKQEKVIEFCEKISRLHH